MMKNPFKVSPLKVFIHFLIKPDTLLGPAGSDSPSRVGSLVQVRSSGLDLMDHHNGIFLQ